MSWHVLHPPRLPRPLRRRRRWTRAQRLHRWRHRTGSGRRQAPRRPPTNDLRMFTYEGNDDHRPAQGADCQVRRAKRAQQRPRSTPCRAQVPPCIPTSCAPSCSAASGPDVWRIWGGQIGAPFVKGEAGHGPRPVLPEVRLGLQDQHGGDRGHDLRWCEGRGALHLPRDRRLVQQGRRSRRRASRPTRPATRSWRRPTKSSLAAGTTPLATAGKYGWHIMRLLRVPAGDLGRPGAARQAADRRGELGPAGGGHRLHELQEVAGRRSGYRRALWAWIRPTSSRGTCRARPPTRSPDPGPRRQAIQAAKKDSADFGSLPVPDRPDAHQRHSGFVEGYMINAKSGNPDKSAELIDFIVQAGNPEGTEDLRVHRQGCRTGSEGTCRCPISGRRVRASSRSTPSRTRPSRRSRPTSTSRSRATVLQGKTTPAEAAKQMQDVVSAWAKS